MFPGAWSTRRKHTARMPQSTTTGERAASSGQGCARCNIGCPACRRVTYRILLSGEPTAHLCAGSTYTIEVHTLLCTCSNMCGCDEHVRTSMRWRLAARHLSRTVHYLHLQHHHCTSQPQPSPVRVHCHMMRGTVPAMGMFACCAQVARCVSKYQLWLAAGSCYAAANCQPPQLAAAATHVPFHAHTSLCFPALLRRRRQALCPPHRIPRHTSQVISRLVVSQGPLVTAAAARFPRSPALIQVQSS
jgi:hypothetical protein